MTTALEMRNTAGSLTFNPEQRKLIRDTFANGASDNEFAALMAVAERRGLDPFLRQVYFVKRWDSQKRCEVWAVQSSIDGLRSIAQRTTLYDGQDEPEFVNDDKGKLLFCRVRVYRKDWSRPAVGIAYWAEYAQVKKDGGLTSFWATKPHVMIAKCAEALALRKAFPEDTSGIYIPEEMGDDQAAAAAVDVTPKPAPVVAAAAPKESGTAKPTSATSAESPAATSIASTTATTTMPPDSATAEPPHDAKTGEVIEASLADKLTLRIQSAKTPDDLSKLGGEIKLATDRKLVSDAERQVLADLYIRRRKTILVPEKAA